MRITEEVLLRPMPPLEEYEPELALLPEPELPAVSPPLYVITEDMMTTQAARKACLLPVQKLQVEIREGFAGNVYRISLLWLNNACKPKLYNDLVELISMHLKYHSLNNMHALSVVRQNMVIGYWDDEDDFVTIRSWLELAHAVCLTQTKLLRFLDENTGCYINDNILKLVIKFPKELFKGDAARSQCSGSKVRVTNVSGIGATIRCGHTAYVLYSGSVGILYFKNDMEPLWRVYVNTKKATDFVYSQPRARTYLFVHCAKTSSIFVRHYTKGAQQINQSNSVWRYYHIVEMNNLCKEWSADEKKCGKGNVRLAFMTPEAYKAFNLNGSCDHSVILETKSRSFD